MQRAPILWRSIPGTHSMGLFLVGHVLDKLAELPDGCVHLCVSSPPYYGLRDYGVEPTWWSEVTYHPVPGPAEITVHAGFYDLGRERSIEAYVGHLVEVFREVRRVLRDDGTLWLNLGDSYAQARGHGHWESRGGKGDESGQKATKRWADRGAKDVGLKPGDLMLIPHRVALALQADGWYLRSEVCWTKAQSFNPMGYSGACMPSSVTGWRWERHRVKVKSGRVERHGPERGVGHVNEGDVASRRDGATWQPCPGCPKCSPHGGYVLRKGSWRPTRSHEQVFLFAKSKDYFCNAEAVKERTTGNAHSRGRGVNPKSVEGLVGREKQNPSWSSAVTRPVPARNPRGVWAFEDHEALKDWLVEAHPHVFDEFTDAMGVTDTWAIQTEPLKEKHYASFPTRLVRPVTLAATPEKCCSKCGAPWAPVVEKKPVPRQGEQVVTEDRKDLHGPQYSRHRARVDGGQTMQAWTSRAEDHRPTCSCDAPPARSVVLDCFAGSGTSLLVAEELGRDFIGIDLDERNYGIYLERWKKLRGEEAK